MKVHILDDWFSTLAALPGYSKLADHDVTVFTEHEPDPVKLAQRHQDAECLVLFRERTQIGAALLDKLPNLKLISQRSVYPHVDVPACTRNNILMCSNMSAGAPNFAAAEMTLGLILASFRQIPQQNASLKAGNWQMGVGRTLRGRKLGLYGYGRIAGAVAEYARSIGMDVWFWASDEGRARAAADGVQVAPSRDAFFSQSDVISLHLRLTPKSKGIVTADDLAMMQPRALLVNTSRSGLIGAGVLEAEIAKGSLHAAVDVFDTEPMVDTSNILATHPNVLASPHIGFVTEDEFEIQFSDIYDQINAYAEGAPIHMVNPEVWS